MDADQDRIGHKLFEDWRGADWDSLAPEQRPRMADAMRQSRDEYQARWDQDLREAGEDESAVRASLNKFDATLSDAISQPTESSSPMVRPNEPGRPVPETRDAPK